jgi:tRNA A37 methylthiotransferase MiaB
MGREYTAEDAIDILQRIQVVDPNIMIRSNVLVGFPGETDDDFALTKSLVAKVNFAEITVNRYEDRPMTESALMPEKVSKDVIEKRAMELALLGCHILS